MSSYITYSPNEIDLSNITFEKPVKDEKNILRSSICYQNKTTGFVIQTPKLIIRDSSDTHIELLIGNKQSHIEFYHTITHLEDLAVNQIIENSGDWFPNQDNNRHVVESSFRTFIHRPLDINDPFILKIPKTNNFDVEHNYPCICLIKFDGIVYGKQLARLDMKVVKIKIIKPEQLSYPEQNNEVSSVYNDLSSVAPSTFKPSDKIQNKSEGLSSFIDSIFQKNDNEELVKDENENENEELVKDENENENEELVKDDDLKTEVEEVEEVEEEKIEDKEILNKKLMKAWANNDINLVSEIKKMMK